MKSKRVRSLPDYIPISTSSALVHLDLADLPRARRLAVLAREDLLPALVERKLRDNAVARRDSNLDGRAIDLVPGDALHVDDILETVDLLFCKAVRW